MAVSEIFKNFFLKLSSDMYFRQIQVKPVSLYMTTRTTTLQPFSETVILNIKLLISKKLVL